MEKFLEFDKTKYHEASVHYRFQCDCHSAQDALDIDVEAWGKDFENKFITLRLDFIGTGLWDRIKYAIAILRGHWSWREFIPCERDYPNMVEIFSDKKYSELP